MQLITEYTPKAAKNMPIIGLYFNLNLILVLISVVLTIIVLNFHFRGPKKQRVPRWMRKYIIGYIGRLFCFNKETYKYHLEEKDTKLIKTNNNKSNQDKNIKKNDSDDSEIEYLSNRNQPAYIKNSNRHNNKNDQIILEYSSNETDLWCNHEQDPTAILNKKCKIKSPKQNDLAFNNELKNNKKKNLFSNEVCKNLERMLNKMEKSFDPFKLKDDDLKFAILKEILECQRLLLTCNLFSNKNNNKTDKDDMLTINQIYDEWKILAMVVDRICFFFYLLALIISSVLFILSEENLFDQS